jgi:hypothetical protein
LGRPSSSLEQELDLLQALGLEPFPSGFRQQVLQVVQASLVEQMEQA